MTNNLKSKYDYDQVNYIIENPKINFLSEFIQRIETHRGCPNLCSFCKEPNINIDFKIPKISQRYVQILDMNFLSQKNIILKIKELGHKKLYYKKIYFELVCGLDYRLLTQEIAEELKKSNFIKIRIAWDNKISDQYKIKSTLKLLKNAGYSNKNISCFMIINHKISFEECLNKMDILKVWNIKICDCCYDGGYKLHIPKDWKEHQIKLFRKKSRKHNQLINFQCDPEIKKV